ncbi:hypothetical protein [uncultured Bifidobacterium sp.]|uniref:hypothetical protein n=1 Tax=uncultured Bifidobacterium sp. TaxID=165187 RepID=UPI00258BFE14|nr:hypothetical protein [uncultured Bifidobacterium sp.]
MTATAPNYDRTVVACFNGYITQAVINNFMPLLFVTFSASFGIDMAQLSTRAADPYPALIAAIVLYAIGGGLIEVMVSPIVNACPSEHKDKAMSLLHSFYCWGQVGTVAVSTLFFALAGRDAWPVMACLWAIVPIVGIVLFAVAGDLGCTAGPAIVGTVAAANGDSLQAGLLVGALFPVILLVGVIALRQILYITRRNG